jgi:dienelactone hydrolase
MRAAVEWLRGQGRAPLGLLGHSKAGSGVVLYAAKYDDVPRVVNVSGRFDMQRGAPARPRPGPCQPSDHDASVSGALRHAARRACAAQPGPAPAL